MDPDSKQIPVTAESLTKLREILSEQLQGLMLIGVLPTYMKSRTVALEDAIQKLDARIAELNR